MGVSGLIWHMQGIRRWNLDIHEYSSPDRATGTMSITSSKETRALRLVGDLDERWMDEIGCDEMRIIALDTPGGDQLSLQRYRLEFWSGGEMGVAGSFAIDSFEALLFEVRRVFVVKGRGTAVIPDRFPFGEKVRAGDDVVIRGGDRPPLPTTIWGVEAARQGLARQWPDAPATVLLPVDVAAKVHVGQNVWLASHR